MKVAELRGQGYVPTPMRATHGSPSTRIIGFWAPAPQSGKTTAATHIEDLSDGYRIGFADPLRRLILTFLRDQGVSHERVLGYMNDGALKETIIPEVGKSFIELAICLGTTFGRDWVGSETWVNAWKVTAARFLKAQNEDGPILTDDVRFPNEVAAIHALGGIMVGILRPGATVSEARAKAEGKVTVEQMDVVVMNDGSLDDLKRNVVAALRQRGVVL